MKSLREVVQWLNGASRSDVSEKTICVREPWTSDSDARLVDLDEESQLPPDAETDGYKYFLEAFVAREVMDVLQQRPTESSTEDACRLLIYYAENDAYPDWVYR